MPLRIVYVGNFKPAWSTETQVAATLESMGHAIVRAQEDECSPARVEALCGDGVDLLLWTRTWGLRPDDEAHAMLGRLTVPSVCYHLDLYAPIPRRCEVSSKAWWRCRYAFTPDGGSDAFWKRERVNHFYLKAGIHAPDAYLAEPSKEWRGFNVAFVGSRTYHPEWPWRVRLLDWLRKTYSTRFLHVGLGAKGPHACVRGERLNALYATVPVIVGDSLCVGFNHPHYWSDRVYETLGRGGFLLHPRIEGMADEFIDGEHLAYFEFGDFAGLKAKIDHYLAAPEERDRIRRAGHEKVKAACTYTHRLAELLATVARCEPQIASKL
jgi:hypothetical protein